MTAIEVQFAPPATAAGAGAPGPAEADAFELPMAGLWGWWQVWHGTPLECSSATTWGKFFGRAALAPWHRTHKTAVSSLDGVTVGSAAWAANGPWQASQFTPSCLPLFFRSITSE